MVALNQAVAMANAGEVLPALEALKSLEAVLEDYQPFYAARAELLARVGQPEAARADYTRSIQLATAPEEQAFLRQKRQELP